MVAKLPRYGPEEFARRGDAIYLRDVTPTLKPDDNGKIVAIDIESGQWEIDPSEVEACDRLEKRLPNAQIWLARFGSRAVRRIRSGRLDREAIRQRALDEIRRKINEGLADADAGRLIPLDDDLIRRVKEDGRRRLTERSDVKPSCV